MPQTSSIARHALPPHSERNEEPFVPDGGPALDTTEHGSRIRARRRFSATAADVLAAWTSPPAWQRWLRLRWKCRAIIDPCEGGEFRLEVAEGPAIHVITGVVVALDAERLSLAWHHHDWSEHSSSILVTIHATERGAGLLFVHDHIACRREASWLMRLWASALDRLDDYLSRFAVAARQHRASAFSPAVDPTRASGERLRTFARSA